MSVWELRWIGPRFSGRMLFTTIEQAEDFRTKLLNAINLLELNSIELSVILNEVEVHPREQ